MVLIRGSEPNTKIVIGIETTFGAAQTLGLLELPIISETLTINSQALPESQEIRATGALASIDDGRNYVQGSITVRPKYNSEAIANLICCGVGGMERRNPDIGSTGTALVSTIACHLFVTQAFGETATGSQSGVGRSFTIYAWKSGPDTSGTVERFRGAICTGFSFDQPANDHPTMTFNFIAIAPGDTDMIAAGSAPAYSAASGLIDVLGSDLQVDSGTVEVPSGVIYMNGIVVDFLNSFSVTLDGNYSIPDASLLNIDSMEKTGHDAPWSVTVTGQGALPQAFYGANQVINKFHTADGVMDSIAFRAIYCSEQFADVAESANYHFDILVDTAVVVDYTNNITESGLVDFSFELRGTIGSTTATSSGAGVDWIAPLIIQMCCNDTDDGGATFTAAAEGGNDAPLMKA